LRWKDGTVHAIHTGMSRVKRTKDGIDILEHAMQGVRTSENRGQIVSFHAEPGIIGMRSKTSIRPFTDTPVEREVIVPMPRVRDRRRHR
jgi:hypothetical protein